MVLAALLLAACGSEPAKVDTARANGPTPAASAPIVNQSIAETAGDAKVDGGGPAIDASPPPKPLASASERYRAIGTEPFWAVSVKGSSAILERPDKPPRAFAVSRNDDERTIRYIGQGFTMTVSEGPCSDGMSDAVWSDQVSIAFGEGTLKGCGGERQDPEDGPSQG